MKKKYVIFAPHVDDELIGCWSLIRQRAIESVYYFFDITYERREEALHAAETFGYDVFFNIKNPTVGTLQTILVPNIRDQHPHHKLINNFVKTQYPDHNKRFYSIDMNYKVSLISDYEDKKNALLTHFPSQKSLFNDGKYYLFESLQEFESDVFYKISHKSNSVEITLPDHNDHKKIKHYLQTHKSATKIALLIQSKYPAARYRIELNNKVIYSGNYLT